MPELTEIRIRSDSSDVRTLLWEIRRLRALVLRADQLLRCLDSGAGSMLIRDVLGKELEGEPCVDESPKLDLTRLRTEGKLGSLKWSGS